MDYRVYIYKSSAVTADAIAIHQLNLAVSTKSLLSWRESTSRFMCAFDIDRISERIRALVGERCRIHTLKPPVGYGDIEFLCVETSYKNAASVLPYIHCVTAENDLVLYDAETEKVFYRELINRTFITAKSRVEDYTNAILSEMNPVCSIHMISAEIGERDCEYSYVVTLRKGSQESFRKRCEEFYECLRKNLLADEDLYTGK